MIGAFSWQDGEASIRVMDDGGNVCTIEMWHLQECAVLRLTQNDAISLAVAILEGVYFDGADDELLERARAWRGQKPE